MICEWMKAVLPEIDRLDEIDPSIREAALAHAAGCVRCARRLERARAVSAAYGLLAATDRHRQAPPAVEAALLAAFRSAPAAQRRHRRSAGWWIGLAAAAALAVSAGYTVIHQISRAHRLTREAVQTSSAMAPDRAAAAGAGSGPQVTVPSPSAASRESSTAVGSEPDEMAEMTGFLPLPFANDDSPIGSGELVRVRLAQASFNLLGLPAPEADSSQPVTADVVIGEDGVARAIRFVSGPVPADVLQQLEVLGISNQGEIQ